MAIRGHYDVARGVVDVLVGNVFDPDFDELFLHVGSMADLPKLDKEPLLEETV